MTHEPETAWAQETNQDFEMTLEKRIDYSMRAPECRLYDVLMVPHDASGNPLNLAAEREYITQDELHARVMAPMAAGYRRAVVHPSGPLHSIYVMTYDEAGVLYEILVVGRA